jgi:hypothetical protein
VGTGANFKNANLIDANLRDANLARSSFQSASLQGAELVNADLRQADLDSVNFAGANLKTAKLQEADLENATMTDVLGLKTSQLGGANLAGAKLPSFVIKPAELTKISALLRPVKGMLYASVAICLYLSYIVLWDTTDALLLTGGTITGRIFGFPLNRFFIVLPLILLIFYLFLHFYLQRLWEQLADMPAIFPSRRTLDEVFPVWFVIIMVRMNFRLLGEQPLSAYKRAFFIFLAWWLIPISMLFFYLRYLPVRDWTGTVIHALCITIAVGAGIQFYKLAVGTLRGHSMDTSGKL